MRPSGPIPADIMIVGEAPGAEEERIGEPFVGASGRLLTDVLHSVGIIRSACFITNVCNVRPPKNEIDQWMSTNKGNPDPTWVRLKDRWVHPHIAAGYALLQKHLEAVKPRLVIALGGTALWALTGESGILKWRGSRLVRGSYTVVPTIHPASILRQASQGVMLQMDLRRAKNIFDGKQQPRAERFTIAPSGPEVISRLDWLAAQAAQHSPEQPLLLAPDIETRGGAMACFGVAWTPEDAICIPFLQANPFEPFYWSNIEDEAAIRHRIYRLFLDKRILWAGQNFLYDAQYTEREGMHYPLRVYDTMIGHHAIFSNLRKGLDFLSSMYAQNHVYWKDESKNWDPALGERQLWTYNCRDCVRTYEAVGGELELLAKESKR